MSHFESAPIPEMQAVAGFLDGSTSPFYEAFDAGDDETGETGEAV